MYNLYKHSSGYMTKFILIGPNYKLTLWLPEVINVKLLPTNPYIIQETGDENIQTYQVEAAILI